MKKRMISFLLVLVMVLGCFPTAAFAAEPVSSVEQPALTVTEETTPDSAAESDTGNLPEGLDADAEPAEPEVLTAERSVGSIHVVVENNTVGLDSELWYATPEEQRWTGKKIDDYVDGATAMEAIVNAVNNANLTIAGADAGFINEIAGLFNAKSGSATPMAGWMGTVNDWFTSQGFNYIPVAAGDEVRVMYSMQSGSDLGGSWGNTDKTLKSLSPSAGTLKPSFSKEVKAYTLALDGETTLNLAPVASNKNFQVHTYVGETYDPTENGFRNHDSLTVKPGDTIQVVVGHPDWPSMNNGQYGGAENVPEEVYKISVIEKSAEPTVTFESFFEGLTDVAEVQNSQEYPMEVTEGGEALVSTNAQQSDSISGLTFTFSKPAELSFLFKTSSESKFDFLRISKNGQALNDDRPVKGDFSGEMADFKPYSIKAAVNDTLEVVFKKDFSGNRGQDCVWLKDFAVKTLATVTFPKMPQGAAITVKQGGTIVEPNADGVSWTLNDGDYTYSADCFGYKSVKDAAFKVNGQDLAVDGTLEQLASATVKFALTPADAVVTVKQGDVVVTAQKDGSYILPVSETAYDYTVTATGYASQSGKVTVANETAQNITVTLTKGSGWDGTATEPKQDNNVYQISTASELAWFAQQVNGGNSAISGVLTENLTLSDPAVVNQNWTPIGSQANPFTGSFDGQGHTVTGLYIHNADKTEENQGLFGVIGKGGAIRGLILTNPDLDTESTLGAVAGENRGLISGCGVTGGVVKSGGGHVVGGVVGYNTADGTVELCRNAATVQNPDSMSGDRTAGIAGENKGVILDCYNIGEIKGHNVSGIAGYGSSYSDSCKIENCYNGGTLTANSNWNKYHISNYSKRINCYFIDTNDSLNSDSNSTQITTEEAKKVAERLGGAFRNKEDGSLELLWEDPAATYTVTLTVTPADAVVTLTQNGAEKTGTAEAGVHTFTGLTAGTYNYTVSYDAGDCETKTGELVLNGRNVSLTVDLAVKTYDVVFTLDPKDAVLTLKQGETVQEGVVDADAGTVTYHLSNGKYTYSAEKFGYQTSNGTIDVNKAAVNQTVTMSKAQGAEVTFRVTAPEGMNFYEGDPKITVQAGEQQETLTNGTALYLPAGTYTYTIQAATFQTIEDKLVVEAAPQTVEKTMVYSTAWDGQTTAQPQLLEGVYQIKNGYELAWFRDLVNEETKNSKSSDAKAILLDNIDLGNHPWVPIAQVNVTGYGAPENGYTGDFDGNGKTISGLNVQMDGEKRVGLFGVVLKKTYGAGKGSGCVHDLTVEGTVAASQYVGGIAGVACTGAVIRNCTANVTVTASDGFAGGIVGQLKDNSGASASVLENCVNRGAVTAIRTAGGIVGDVSYALTVRNCRNEGTVTGTGERFGGIAGSCSNADLEACANHGTVTSADSTVGGVVGFTNRGVSFCYNTGAVSGKSEKGSRGSESGVGGVVGKLNYTGSNMHHCYNTGVVTDAEGGVGAFGALIGNKSENGIVVENCYYLDTSCAQGMGGSKQDETDQMTACTKEELKKPAMAACLGGDFAVGTAGGNPILACEESGAKYVLAFETKPTDAEVVLKNGETPVAAQEPGVYFRDAKTAYTYTVSKAGFDAIEGAIPAAAQSQLVKVALNGETFAVKFDVTPADAVITVKNAKGQVCEGDKTEYSLPKGKYTYTVEKFGFVSQKGEFEVTNAAVNVPAIKLEAAGKHAVTLNITYEGENHAQPTIQVYRGEELVGSTASLNLPNGTYTYKVIASGYFNAEGKFEVKDQDVTVSVQMQTRTTWDGSKTEPGKDAQGIYQITCAEELAWFAENINSGAIAVNSNAILLADIVVNDEVSKNSWVSIGDYEHKYAGTFDGNGKAVKGLNNPLFGYGGDGSMIKNVTTYGAITGDSNRGAVCTASSGSFEGCVNYASVTATGQRVGGIVGVLYGENQFMKNCANYGSISTTFQAPNYGGERALIGGVVGLAYGTVEGCANFGDVKSENKTNGAIGGVVGQAERTVLNCYNMGYVIGCTGTGGVAGIADQRHSELTNCYNAGQVRATNEYPNPAVGAVVGDVGDSNGAVVGTVTNCYYLENSYHHDHHGNIMNGGLGYPKEADTTIKKTEIEMKASAFVLALGDGYHADSDTPINGGYPVLKWQGGKAPESSEDQQAVADDKLNLTVTPLTVAENMTLTLAASGAKGSKITWKSSDSAIITDAGVVTLPKSGEQTVTLTATIQKGAVSDTKEFRILVRSVQQTTKLEMAALQKAAEKLTFLKPVYHVDTNINDLLKESLMPLLPENNLAVKEESLTVSVVNPGTNTTPYDTDRHIADDGSLTYYFMDPAKSTMKIAVVNDVQLKVQSGSESFIQTVRVNLPWDAERVRQAMQPIADQLTFDVIKGQNTDASNVTSELTLPVVLENYGWSTISWESDNGVVIVQKGSTFQAPSVGKLVPNQANTEAKLTATVTFNKTSDGEQEITITKEIPVTVTGADSTIESDLNAALEKYTVDKLTDSATKKPIDPANVMGSIQLLTPGKLGLDGKYVSVVVTGSSDRVNINGYRANVFRPLPGANDEQIVLTVTLTHKETKKSVSKKLPPLTVKALTKEEIGKELALMEQVKTHYFDGIRNENTDPNAITTDMHGFQEAYLGTDGQLVWVYDRQDRTYTGIVPTDIPKEGYDESYNLFKSSKPNVVKHENLLVTQPAKTTEVTITSCLGSQAFCGYAKKYPDYPDFAKLENQMVSVTVKVLGKNEPVVDQAVQDVIAKIDAIGSVTLESADAIKTARALFEELTPEQQKQVTNIKKLEAAEAELERLMKEDKDKRAAEKVVKQIEAIGEVTLQKEAKIKAARQAYEKLTKDQKGYVTNLKTLEQAEATLKELQKPNLSKIYDDSAAFLLNQKIGTGSVAGEWTMLGLARSEKEIPEQFRAQYEQALTAFLEANCDKTTGRLDAATDNERIALAVTALGYDARNYHGFDLLKALHDEEYVKSATVNNEIFAILALNAREEYVDQKLLLSYRNDLISRQDATGGWLLLANDQYPSYDITAMAVQALAPFYGEPSVKTAVDRAMQWLEAQRTPSSSEACAQMICAYTALGREPSQQVMDAMLKLAVPGSGFRHDRWSSGVNQMSTDQAFYALTAYLRQQSGKTSLYNMRDIQPSDVEKVIRQIDAIGNVTLESADAIKAARAAFEELTPEQQKQVTNLAKLKAAEAELERLMKEDEEKRKVEKVIKQIEDIGSVTLESADAIKTARAAFEELTPEQQKQVTNIKKLEAAEAELERLMKEDKDKRAAEKVVKQIDAIGEVTLQKEAKIKAARQAYEKLTKDQQGYVTNLKTLEQAEATLKELQKPNFSKIYDDSAAFLLNQKIGTGSVAGEWTMLGLARSEKEIPKYFRTQYEQALTAFLEANYNKTTGRLDRATDNERIALAVTALGYDARNYHGFDLLKALHDEHYVKSATVNNEIFAILALNAREEYVDQKLLLSYRNDLVSRQDATGGWKLQEEDRNPDLDITAMAVQALAPFYGEASVKTAVDRAMQWLEAQRAPSSAEGCAQVICAYTALGREPSQKVMDAMLKLAVPGSGFKHDRWSHGVNQMSTDQAFYAMTAYLRQQSGKTALYNMRDVKLVPVEETNADTVKKAMEQLQVTRADRATYYEIQQIQNDYSKLTQAEKNSIQAAYEAFRNKVKTYDTLLEAAVQNAKKKLRRAFEELEPSKFTPEQWKQINEKYNNAVHELERGRYEEELDEIIRQFNASVESIKKGTYTVTFRLIGDSKHGNSKHTGYITWIPTTTYSVSADATVYDVFVKAISDAGMQEKGSEKNYVSTIRAPQVLGGFWLGEFDNGKNSGWMYTVNGRHPDVGLKDCKLQNGDSIVWHYVDDYIVEMNAFTWLEAKDITPEEYLKSQTNSSVNNFHDVHRTDWFYDDVQYAVSAGLFNGTSDTTFSPNNPMTRAMLVTVLYRLEGEPAVRGTSDFTDVGYGTWYADAVKWAADNEIVNGVGNDLFAPNNNITREQMAAILYRYAEYKRYNTTASNNLMHYQDYDQISVYALDALKWANAEGLINGRTTVTLAPAGTATRAEVAAILHRFVENVVK